jgi:GTP-binding protein
MAGVGITPFVKSQLYFLMNRNVAPQVTNTDPSNCYDIFGCGQLHLTVLIETMRGRHEGFELEVGPPTVIYKGYEESAKIEEPLEIAEIRVMEK